MKNNYSLAKCCQLCQYTYMPWYMFFVPTFYKCELTKLLTVTLAVCDNFLCKDKVEYYFNRLKSTEMHKETKINA